jgi:methylamine utilization protein MauE
MRDWSALICATASIFVSLVFARSIFHKLTDFESFAAFVAAYRLVPEVAVATVSRLVIILEIMAMVALLMPRLRAQGGALAIGMLLAYAGAMSINILRGHRQIDCGCGGASQPLSWPLVTRNLVLAGCATPAFLGSEELALGAAGLVATSGFVLWLGYLLSEQLLANQARWRR